MLSSATEHNLLRPVATFLRHHSEDDIRSLVDALAYHLPLALKEEGSQFSDIAKRFRRSLPIPAPAGSSVSPAAR